MKTRLLPVLTLLAACGGTPTTTPQGSRTCHDVTLPSSMSAGGTTLTLNGMAVRDVTIFDVDVYVGALYLERTTRDATEVVESRQHKRIVLRFIRDVTQHDIVNAWESGFINNAGAERLGLSAEIAAFEAMFEEVHEADEMQFDYAPDGSVSYTLNGALRGTVSHPAFARAFLLVFFGPEPPSRQLRDGLLGGACD